MIVIILSAICVVAFVDGTTTVIQLSRSGYHFPIESCTIEGNTTIRGYAVIDTMHSFAPYTTFSNRDAISCSRMLVGHNRASIDFETPIGMTPGAGIVLSVGHGSEFARRFPSHLFTPTSETETILVLNPLMPAEYAFSGRILYASLNIYSSLGIALYPFRGALRFVHESGVTEATQTLTDSDFFPLGISFESQKHTIPRRLLIDFAARAGSLGIRISIHRHYICLYNITEEQLQALPSFDIITQTEDGTSQFQIGRLEPLDYLTFSEESNSYRLDITDSSAMTIYRNVTGSLVIHFDYGNNRIGFADPIAEL